MAPVEKPACEAVLGWLCHLAGYTLSHYVKSKQPAKVYHLSGCVAWIFSF